jgi:hypothetical protein
MSERTKCFYYSSLEVSSGVRDIINQGLVKYNQVIGEGHFCDYVTPISVNEIPIDGSLDMTCYGPDDPKCPGFLLND